MAASSRSNLLFKCVAAGLATCVIVTCLIVAAAMRRPTRQVARDDKLIHFDFGSAWVMSDVTHDFVLENSSAKDLIVDAIDVSCTCLVPATRPSRIPARSSVVLPVRAKLSTVNAGSDRFAATVIVRLHDAPSRLLQLTGQLIFDAPSGSIEIGNVLSDAVSAPVSFELRGHDPGIALAIERAEYDKDKLELSWAQRSDNRAIIDVEARVKTAGRPAGEFDETVQFMTNDAKRPARGVRLHGRVFGQLEADPPDLNFGLLAPGEPRDLWVKVFSPAGKSVDIDDVKLPSNGIFAIRDRRVEPDAVWLNIELKSAFSGRSIVHGTIDVHGRLDGAVPATFSIRGFAARAD